jgi:hypothetical protein
MTRERIEDLGRIAQMLRDYLKEDSPMDACNSKHSVDSFIKDYSSEDKLDELHDWLRWHREKLEQIESIAWGTDEMNWTISGHSEYE